MSILPRGTDIPGESRVSLIIIGNLIPLVFASIFVIARLYARAVVTRSWGSDDTVLSLAYVTCLINGICACAQTQYGSGHHASDIPQEYQVTALKFSFVTLLAYQITLSLTKISICLFYLRLFVDKTSQLLTKITLVVIVLYTIPFELISIFQCTPVSHSWNIYEKGHCFNTIPTFYAAAIMNIVVDVWLIGLVVPRILRLKMALRQKVTLFVVVTLGWLVVIAGIVRVVRVSAILHAEDRPWVSYDSSIWSATEACVGIFCVAAPAIKPLLQRYAPGLLSSLSGGLTYSNENYAGKGTRGGNTTIIRTGNRNTQNGIELHSTNGDGDIFDKDGLHRNAARSSSGLYKSGVKFKGSDSESTENVLASGQDEKDGIMKTMQISVAVDDRPNSESSDTIGRHEDWHQHV